MENEEDPTDVDIIAKEVDRAQYRQMAWDNEGLFQTAKAVKFPKVIAIVSKQDHYVPVDLQIETIKNFARRHPQIQVEILYTPTKHDPTASFKVNGNPLVHTGVFLRNVIDKHFHPAPLANRITEVTYPDYEEAPVCAEFVAFPHIGERLRQFIAATDTL